MTDDLTEHTREGQEVGGFMDFPDSSSGLTLNLVVHNDNVHIITTFIYSRNRNIYTESESERDRETVHSMS